MSSSSRPKIGLIGLGKLGFPVAVTFGQTHEVFGFDLNPALLNKERKEMEEGPSPGEPFELAVKAASLSIEPSMANVADKADIIFVAVQTPHEPLYEGVTRLPETRVDFNYEHLIKACHDLSAHLLATKQAHKTVVVISTVLPGTMKRHIMPLVPNLVYNPFFIAMGTVMQDLIKPEFVLLGSHSQKGLDLVSAFYSQFFNHWTFTPPPVIRMAIESAEMAKVCYNLWISLKVAATNATMELCDKTGADIDEVMGALKLAKARILAPRYMSGGMGDGGGCHPRDCIAMSWAAENYGMSHDLFEAIMLSREAQAEWLADMMIELESGSSSTAIFGYAFKPGTRITTGSHAMLVANILREKGREPVMWDPHIDTGPMPSRPATILIGCKHEAFKNLKFAPGSYVIDPHRFIPDQPGVRVYRLGQAPRDP